MVVVLVVAVAVVEHKLMQRPYSLRDGGNYSPDVEEISPKPRLGGAEFHPANDTHYRNSLISTRARRLTIHTFSRIHILIDTNVVMS